MDPQWAECRCPDAGTISRHFDAKVAGSEAPGEEPNLHRVSQRLLDALRRANPAGRSVLELGCGRAGLLLQLVTSGAARATGVDLSPAAIDYARSRFASAGVADGTDFSVGDAAHVPLEPHDWVILDRVICCYPDVDRLLSNATSAARRFLAFTVPSSRGWRGVASRLEGWLEWAVNAVRGGGCRGYVHDLDMIERRLLTAGFHLRHQDQVRLWHLAIFERGAS